MKFVRRFIVAFLGNSLGILAARQWVPGFSLETVGVLEIATLGAVLTLLNIFLRPLVKIFFGPFIIITLGAGLFAVNALMLYLLDIGSENLTIVNIPSLLYATLLFSFLNFTIHIGMRS